MCCREPQPGSPGLALAAVTEVDCWQTRRAAVARRVVFVCVYSYFEVLRTRAVGFVGKPTLL